MARYTEGGRSTIDQAVELWKNNCLLGHQSLVFADEDPIWSLANIEDLYARFHSNQLSGDAAGGRFSTKWNEQLRGASDAVRQLGAELLLVHFLFPNSITRRGKLNVITESLGGTDIEIPDDKLAIRALAQVAINAG